MKIKNVSNKIIGIGEMTALPGEVVVVPKAFALNPTLEVYEEIGMVEILEKDEVIADDTTEGADDSKDEAEELRKARLESLKNITEEDLAKLANELGINPAECKDQADVLKKVKAMLKK